MITLKEKSITVDGGEEVSIVGFLFLPRTLNLDSYLTGIEQKKVNSSDKLELDKPYLILFNNAVDQNNFLVKPDEYIKMLQKIIPSSEEVVDFIIKNNKELDIVKFNIKLKEWGYDIGSITYGAWSKAREIIIKTSDIFGSKNNYRNRFI